MSEKTSFGHIIQSSSQEILFEAQMGLAEDKYVLLIEETAEKVTRKLLGVVTQLIHSKGSHNGKINILGELDEAGKLIRCRVPPAINSKIIPPPIGLVSSALSYDRPDGICLGKIADGEPFSLQPNILSRHALVAATTGAGKSYCVGVLLEELLQKTTDKAFVIFDVSSEYWGLAYKNPDTVDDELTKYNLKTEGLWERVKVLNPKDLALSDLFDLNRLKYLLELTPSQNTALVTILKEKMPLNQLINEIEADTDRIHPSTKQGILSRLRSLEATGIYRSTPLVPLTQLLTPGQAVIVSLDQADDDWIRSIIVKDICFELYQEKIRGADLETDVVLVIEEAHRYSGKEGSKSILEAIAREGRKFGIFQILITQRPKDIDSEVIANLNTLIALRIKNDQDLAKIKRMESVDTSIIRKLPRLEKGEAVIVGETSIASHPILIKIRPRQTKHVDPRIDQMPPDIQQAIEAPESLFDEEDIESSLEESDTSSLSLINSSSVDPPTAQTLDDALNVLHIIVMSRSTGLAIYDEGTGLNVEVQLVAGSISALKSLLGEIGKVTQVKGRTRIRVLQEEGFLIWSCEGELSIIALLLKRPGSKELERRLRSFVYAFEKQFKTELEAFYGSTEPFEDTRDLADLYLGTGFLRPLRIFHQECVLSEDEKITLDNILEVQQGISPQEGQYLEEIIQRTTTRLDSSLSYGRTLNSLIGLAQKQLLFSPTKQNLWIWELPEIEKRREEKIFESKETIKEQSLSEIEQEIIDEFLIESDIGKEVKARRDATRKSLIGRQTATLEQQREAAFKEPTVKGSTIEITAILEALENQPSPNLPEDILEDILIRDVKYSPEFRAFSRTIRVEKIPITDIERFFRRLDETGHKQLELRLNPMKGPVVVLQSTSGKKSVVSISKVNGFCLIIVAN
ncbi:MAG: ATP-binding protein [Candidatus Hodarchaeota archaeon]